MQCSLKCLNQHQLLNKTSVLVSSCQFLLRRIGTHPGDDGREYTVQDHLMDKWLSTVSCFHADLACVPNGALQPR